MTLDVLQIVDKKAFEKNTIKVGGQSFKVNPEVKIFIDGRAVQAKDVESNLKKLSLKEVELLKTQLEAIQEYSGVYKGAHDTIDPGDFERCNKEDAKKKGISFKSIMGDENFGSFKCANGRFELLW